MPLRPRQTDPACYFQCLLHTTVVRGPCARDALCHTWPPTQQPWHQLHRCCLCYYHHHCCCRQLLQPLLDCVAAAAQPLYYSGSCTSRYLLAGCAVLRPVSRLAAATAVPATKVHTRQQHSTHGQSVQIGHCHCRPVPAVLCCQLNMWCSAYLLLPCEAAVC